MMKHPIQSYLSELAQLFAGMDDAYCKAAERLGFQCRGCETNCCRSLFYHHTLAEWLYLRSGLARLPQSDQDRIRRRAEQVRTLQDLSGCGLDDPAQRPLCPLNGSGCCRLYAHRPMICRLHGIPHELHSPSGQCRTGPGCDDYRRQTLGREGMDGYLDRTPWYSALARLEKQLRGQVGFERKLKLTIAAMIIEEPPDFEILI